VKAGFLLGSIALIATWVLVQDGVSGRVDQASNVFVAMLRRVMSADAAGIGHHGQVVSQTINDHTTPSSGGGSGPKFY
jgi:hypothetical protein